MAGKGHSFRAVVVVGIGLIGGSLAAAIRKRRLAELVFGVDSDASTRDYAIENGIVDDALAPRDAFLAGWFAPEGADLVILATPALAAVDWLGRLGEVGYRGIVTDVASTKMAVMAGAAAYLGEKAVFVGGHPMAGSERSGIKAADADLFEGAYYVLTPTESTDVEAYRKLNALVSALGARVVPVDARHHDEAVAVISHVPHVAAAALINIAAARGATAGEDVLRLAAGGFKDMTRIAAGSPELWTGICLDNKDALARGVDELIDELAAFASYLNEGNRLAVKSWLAAAAEVRRELPSQWVPAATALTELLIPISDRPGVVAEVTMAVGRAGCNIEDIEIDHQTEDRAVLRVVITDEGDQGSLVKSLRSLGYEMAVHRL
ncbi:MAG TPA: prephenate dehydrogenase [Coriobacteriia bacterium]|jgi:prephenate dehydrogenase